jgi:hypothetical protein
MMGLLIVGGAWLEQATSCLNAGALPTDARRNPVSTQPASVLTGRTVEEVAAAGGE